VPRRAFGQRLVRADAERLVSGGGRYLDDLEAGDALHAAIFRSPFAHARITNLDLSAAREAPGVVAVYSAVDLGKVGGPLPYLFPHAAVDQCVIQRPLALDEVHYAGQPVAMVVAEDRYLAEDALELVEVDFDPLPAVVGPEHAVEDGTPRVHEQLRDNVAATFRQRTGDPDAAFAAADLVVTHRFEIERSSGMPLETRGILARWDADAGELELWDSTQHVVDVREKLAEVLGLAPERVRVVAPDVGGGFGTKVHVCYPEEVLVPFAARELDRPVKYVEDRLESFVASHHERGQVHDVELAATSDGVVTAMRDRFLHDSGAFIPQGLQIPSVTASHIAGPYRIPNLDIEFRAVYTNTVPVTPYRGCGRPHACFVLERALDRLAGELGLDPAEVRRRNLIAPEEFPYAREGLESADGGPVILDSGNYVPALEAALERVGYEGFAEERELAREEGVHLGIGMACYIEGTGLGPHEAAKVRVEPDSGRFSVIVALPAQGQAHETTFAQIAADALGVEVGEIDIRGGDTALSADGAGTYASRAAVVAGNAVHAAALDFRERALAAASERLDVPVAELQLGPGRVFAPAAPELAVTFEALGPELEGNGRYSPPYATYSNGVHACVVEVDADTFDVRYRRYVCVHDCGNMINPSVVEGQVLGGIAQGVGGALYERLAYDADGELRNGSFMEFLMPYATEVPAVTLGHLTTPSPLNPLGIKGAGESGTIPVPAVTVAAVEDALRSMGVDILLHEAPLSPERLCELAGAGSGRDELGGGDERSEALV
jgi:carbon-monoxide dehydrogenase large subunit